MICLLFVLFVKKSITFLENTELSETLNKLLDFKVQGRYFLICAATINQFTTMNPLNT